MTGIAFTLLGWLTGSKLGRWVAMVSIMVVMAMWMLYAARRSGIKAEQARQVTSSLNNLRKRIQTDDKIRNLSPDARRDRLREWASG